MNILEFADIIQKNIITTYFHGQDRFSSSFEHGEHKNGCCLVSAWGSSDNMEGSLNDYALKMQGKELVFHATSSDARQEYKCPESFTMIGE